ncbi:MAG: NAD-dependent epimerase/dehydratase family protein, partial [Bdellovibrionales bacterium]|nr:NAD-dependent epimerase/dehydratase family protein [Bdellovibrionales bacterium]
MRVLITGGAGFIGSHLAERYLEEGHEVYVIDNLSTGSMGNIQHLIDHPEHGKHFYFTLGSILEHAKMLDLVATCDLVFHLAAAVGVQYIIDNPLDSIITNVRGTDIVLELCNRFRKKVLVASTSEVYGKHDHAPLVESDDLIYGSPDKYRWSYAAAKLIDEFSCLAYHREKNLSVVVIRLFNVTGPRQTGRYGMVMPRFVDQALAGDPITVYGDGSQTRTFTHVSEVLDAFGRLMETPAAYGKIINIGGRQEVSILELAMAVKKLTGSDSPIKLIPYSEAYPASFEDMQRRVPSTELLRSVIGSAPAMGLHEILESVIE